MDKSLAIWCVLCAAVISFFIGMFVSVGLGEQHGPPITPEEQAAVLMIRVGYDKWVVACAYAVSQDGGSIEVADKACRIKFNLPALNK